MLYPLNVLRARYPDLYERERGKYNGREALLNLRIPVLEVLWNDALHLSPVHPYRVAAAWRTLGLESPVWDGEFLEIPVARLRDRESVWFASGALPGDEASLSLPVDEVSRFDPDAYRELVRLPASYHDYLRRRQEEGRLPRPFAYLPHVLVAAPIDIAGLRLVRADLAPS